MKLTLKSLNLLVAAASMTMLFACGPDPDPNLEETPGAPTEEPLPETKVTLVLGEETQPRINFGSEKDFCSISLQCPVATTYEIINHPSWIYVEKDDTYGTLQAGIAKAIRIHIDRKGEEAGQISSFLTIKSPDFEEETKVPISVEVDEKDANAWSLGSMEIDDNGTPLDCEFKILSFTRSLDNHITLKINTITGSKYLGLSYKESETDDSAHIISIETSSNISIGNYHVFVFDILGININATVFKTLTFKYGDASVSFKDLRWYNKFPELRK